MRHLLLALPGVQSAADDPRVGSLLVTYDPAQTSEAAIVLALDLGSLPERPTESRAFPRMPQGTAGMALSLAVSLGAAAAGIKWLHVASGVVFVTLVGAHVFSRTQTPTPRTTS